MDETDEIQTKQRREEIREVSTRTEYSYNYGTRRGFYVQVIAGRY